MKVSPAILETSTKELKLDALPAKFLEKARKLEGNKKTLAYLQNRSRRCATIAAPAGCWVNFASNLSTPPSLGPALSRDYIPQVDSFAGRLLRLLKVYLEDGSSEATLRSHFWDPLSPML